MSSSPSSEIKPLFFQRDKGQHKSVMIQAGAGAGKTTELVTRVISYGLCFRETHGRWPNIVVTTFTVKATEELRERILKAAILCVENESIPFKIELLNWVQGSSIFITTIHGLVVRFLREEGYRIGFYSDFEVSLSEKEEFYRFFKNSFLESTDDFLPVFDLMKEYSFRQLAEMFHSFCVTRLSHPDLKPICINLEKKKWSENFETVKKKLGKWLEDLINIPTNTEKRRLGFQFYNELFKKDFSNPHEVETFFDNNKDSWSRLTFGVKEIDEERKTIHSQFQDLYHPRNRIEFLGELDFKNSNFYSMASTIFTLWISYKKKTQSIGISEIEGFGIYLSNLFPVSYEKFSLDWNYWFIDEFQDTSPLQVKLLDFLKMKSPCFIVGDPQQSIYLFRGARPHIFKNEWESFSQKKQDQFYLDKNYRSFPSVLNFINSVIVTKKPDDFMLMHPKKEEDGFSFVELSELVLQSKETASLDLISHQIVNQIFQYQKLGISLGSMVVLCRKRQELRQVSDIMLKAQIPFQLHLGGTYIQRREVQDAIILLRFLICPEDDKNLLSLLRTPYFFIEDQTLILLKEKSQANNFWEFISSTVLAELKNEMSRDSWEELNLSSSSVKILQQLNSSLELVQTQGYFYVWKKLLIEANYFKWTLVQDPTGRREANLWKLIGLAQQYLKQGSFSWNEFYWNFVNDKNTSQDEIDAVSDRESNRVQLMTVHASKGLEFEVVIFPFIESRLRASRGELIYFSEKNSTFSLPCIESLSQEILYPLSVLEEKQEFKNWEENEKDRLLYVALTRAKRILSLLWTKDEKAKEQQEGWVDYFKKDKNFKLINEETVNTKHIYVNSVEANETLLFSPLEMFKKSSSSQTYSVTQILSSNKMEKRNILGFEKFKILKRGVDQHKLLESSKSVSNNLLWIAQEFSEYETCLSLGYREWPFKVFMDGFWVQGQIDLWHYEKETHQLFLVDYKTGSSRSIDKAWQQLIYYYKALVLANQLPRKHKASGYLVYLDESKVESKSLSIESL